MIYEAIPYYVQLTDDTTQSKLITHTHRAWEWYGHLGTLSHVEVIIINLKVYKVAH